MVGKSNAAWYNADTAHTASKIAHFRAYQHAKFVD